MASRSSSVELIALVACLGACSRENLTGSVLNDASFQMGDWTSEDAARVEEQWGERLRDPSLVAVCFMKISEDFIIPSLTIRKQRLENNGIGLTGPSFHHEAHISGDVEGVSAPGEGVQKLQINNGRIVEVSGPDDAPEIALGALSLVSTPDDTAHEEFRERVVIESDREDEEWTYRFPNCRVFPVNPAHD